MNASSDEHCSHHHGHEHGHAHVELDAEKQTDLGALSLTAHLHEGVAVVSGELKPQNERLVTFEALADALQRAAETLVQAGGFIGHVKASAKCGDALASFSLTDLEVDPTVTGDSNMALDPATEVHFVALVACIAPEAALSAVAAAF